RSGFASELHRQAAVDLQRGDGDVERVALVEQVVHAEEELAPGPGTPAHARGELGDGAGPDRLGDAVAVQVGPERTRAAERRAHDPLDPRGANLPRELRGQPVDRPALEQLTGVAIARVGERIP